MEFVGTINDLYKAGYRKFYNGEEYVYSYSFPVVKSKSLMGEITIDGKNNIKYDVYDSAYHTNYSPYYYDYGDAHRVLLNKINSVFDKQIKKLKVKDNDSDN